MLQQLLPKILPPDVAYVTIPHDGKSDLQKSIPHKLAGWNIPDSKFINVHDQDSSDCIELKNRLSELCVKRSEDVLIRIACHEMESWYFGDLEAVSKAYGKDLTKYANKSKYRITDEIVNPKQELRALIPEHEQLSGADKIGQNMDIENNKSHSFKVLFEGIRKMVG